MKARRINESPDEISWPNLKYNHYGEAIDNNEWSPEFGDPHSYPFWYENGEFVLGREFSGHPLAIERNRNSFSGRVWADKKILSFWAYPNKSQFQNIAKELSEKLSEKGYDADILYDPEWKVEIIPSGDWRDHIKNFQTKLVSASEYKGSEERNADDLRQNHKKSPMDPTKKPPSYIKKIPKDIRLKFAMGENRLVPETLDELFEFERTGNVMKGVGIGMEARKAEIKKDIDWEIKDTRYHGPGMLNFLSYKIPVIWSRGDEITKLAIKEILEEWLSGKKKWRSLSDFNYLKEILHETGLLFDPKYMVLTPNTWERIAFYYPEESKEFALKYFKPNQIYSVGVNYGDSDMMREGIKRGATNLNIGGNSIFEIPLKNDDGELLKLLLDKSEIDPGGMFEVPQWTSNFENRGFRDESNRALRFAARDGKLNTLRVLIDDPRSNPAATKNFALKWATHNGHKEAARMLLQDERVRKDINLLPKNKIKQLKEWGLIDGINESINFERGTDPKKSMGVGSHNEDLKVYRCGYCGTPTDGTGREIPYDSDEFKRVTGIIDDMNDQTTELDTCDTCAYDMQREEIEAEERAEAEVAWQEEQWRQENGY